MLTQKSSDTTFAKKWKLKLDLDSKIKAPSKAQGFPNRPDPSSWRLKKPAKTRPSSESTGSSPAPWPFESGMFWGCSSRRRPCGRRILRMILDTRYGFTKRKLSPDFGGQTKFFITQNFPFVQSFEKKTESSTKVFILKRRQRNESEPQLQIPAWLRNNFSHAIVKKTLVLF